MRQNNSRIRWSGARNGAATAASKSNKEESDQPFSRTRTNRSTARREQPLRMSQNESTQLPRNQLARVILKDNLNGRLSNDRLSNDRQPSRSHFDAELPERPSTAGNVFRSNTNLSGSEGSGGLRGSVRTVSDLRDRRMTSTTDSLQSIVKGSSSSQFPIADRITSSKKERPFTSGGLVDLASIKSETNSASVQPTTAQVMRVHSEDSIQDSSTTRADVTTSSMGDGICFAESPDLPDVPILYRTDEVKFLNPERLNLERRSLTVCPLLEGEKRLRLLNIQNNAIERIENLYGLPNLIFLDLYNNNIEAIQNLNAIPTLRVLMLGKNQIQSIDNVDCLTKLDVLDLHSNRIEKIENVDKLRELRVLNLAGNRITIVENIAGLCSLTELNLRRNSIHSLKEIHKITSLQRIFLANNQLYTFQSIECLLKSKSITEAALDDNPVASQDAQQYRMKVISSLPQLRHLDLKKVTDEERRESFLRTKQAKEIKQEQKRAELQEAERARAIKMAKEAWQERLDMEKKAESVALNAWQAVEDGEPDVCTKVLSRQRDRAKGRDSYRLGFSEVEICGDSHCLFVYGDALEALDGTHVQSIATAIIFKYLSMAFITNKLSSTACNGLKSFTQLRCITLSHNNLRTLDQLLCLLNVKNRKLELVLSDNPICSSSMIRPFVAAYLPNIVKVNGKEITGTDKFHGANRFSKCKETFDQLTQVAKNKLSLTSTTTACSSRDKKQGEYSASEFVKATIERVDERQLLVEDVDEQFSTVMRSFIEDYLSDLDNINEYMANCLEGL